MSHELTFQVSIPTDEGFVGRACANPDCGQYFKVLLADHKDQLDCPYCGVEFHKNSLLTSDQRDYVTEYAKEEATKYAVSELQKMLKKTFGSSSARRSGISYKPGRVRKRTVRPHYTERKVDTELECPTCNTRFQVYGIFGYCPGCRDENLRIYDANWTIIQREIENSVNQPRALRHAYGDLVSALLGASVSDIDPAPVEGIAIYSLTSSNGTWEYSTDAGGTWTAAGAVAAWNASTSLDGDSAHR